MLREEFNKLVPDGDKVSDQDYQLIEYVYNYHPCNFDKEEIAGLYRDYGMVIFYDMELRAREGFEYDHRINLFENDLKRISNTLEGMRANRYKELSRRYEDFD